MTAVSPFDWLGKAVRDRFDIVKPLSEGGMALVYLACDRQTGEDVIVKTPRPDLMAKDESAGKRFTAELRAMIQLEHRHVVPLVDYGEYLGRKFVVLKYLDGGNLHDRRAVLAAAGPARLLADLPYWLPKIARALDFIHANGHLHRDIKPSNIMFDAAGEAYLGDFGLVKAMPSSKSVSEIDTRQLGLTVGTPRYMSPERIMGSFGSPASDLYGLAVTVYEWLTGVPPFAGSRPDEILQHQYDPRRPYLTRLSEFPEGTAAVFARALELKPSSRHASCTEFVKELEPFWPPPSAVPKSATTATQAISSSVVPTPPASQPMKPTPPPRRGWGRWVVPLLLTAVLCGGTWWLLTDGGQSAPDMEIAWRTVRIVVEKYFLTEKTVTLLPGDGNALAKALEDGTVPRIVLKPGRYAVPETGIQRDVTIVGDGTGPAVLQVRRNCHVRGARLERVELVFAD